MISINDSKEIIINSCDKMVWTIEGGFNEFHTKLTPTLRESEAAKTHRTSIEKTLKKEFSMSSFYKTGSFGNGTSIRSYSDVDYFAVIPEDKINENSTYALRDVRNVLNTRFPRTGISVSTPAVVVPFGTDKSEYTEVIPAIPTLDENKNFFYKIADGSGGWILSNPRIHNEYVTSINDKLRKRVKPLIRFVKAWKYYKNVPISSFYLELRVAKYASESIYITYSTDIKNIFKMLQDNKLASMQDPEGICGYINPCSTDRRKEDALSKINMAHIRAKLAKEAEEEGKIEDAFRWWNRLFNNKFPNYG